MALSALLISFVVLMVLGTPVAVTMFGSSLIYIMLEPSLSLANVASKVVNGVTGTGLLSLPLFILAGEIMNNGGVTQRLFKFPLALMGHFKGGLAYVNVMASMLFAGMSGSAIADTAGLGKIEMDAMDDAGYDKEFSAAITASSSSIGPIIPPSNTMIVYAVAAEVSVARLFMGGMLPGILMGIVLCVYIFLHGKTHDLPKGERATGSEKLHAFVQAFFPILTPIILIVGICSGICTATEAGALAVVYATILNCVYEKGFKVKNMLRCLDNSMITMAQICFIVMASSLFGWVVTLANIPSMIANGLYSMGANKYVILLLLNVIFLIMGMFLSINASLLIMTPVVVTLAKMYGLSLVHLGVMITLNLTLGLLTPPVGWNLYIMSAVSGLPFERVVKAVMPQLIALLVALLLITYIPGLVTWLPNFLFGPGV
ncbi:MAG: TRAP transporter large permease [Synergistaceae bacterium]|nr:TRAP transporter large permease [Synergistaceae bacterium]MBQ6419430.1 TRAP transporter large permease [Synergistaceae bacterium]MBQ9904494.1 TRAP transporter large permease [Synergistaceae bacterium]MBR0186396.1 TRAP transporter large permease [Synergistaceae bacterium]MBR0248249.1 TRAP transporter large permease [Synergistaceae bacterium]